MARTKPNCTIRSFIECPRESTLLKQNRSWPRSVHSVWPETAIDWAAAFATGANGYDSH